MKPATRPPWWELAGFVAWALLVAVLTLTPERGWSPRQAAGCLLCGELGGADQVFYRGLAYGIISRSRALLAASVAAPALVIGLTGWLLEPVQTDGLYYAQWVPRRPYYARWNGRLLDAQVAGGRTPIGRLRDTDREREALVSGHPVELTFRRGSATSSLAAI